jgi:hypothetical protein
MHGTRNYWLLGVSIHLGIASTESTLASDFVSNDDE